ncbi:methyltransferase [Nibricoccus aquaticus]|uniref:Methyltransferase n=1 Tax=Nibricoccus aquaticus TaxID=2576891 RepID=A0A290QBE8_9BACT|nr:RsmD family RNA methyltransferase [Nibricoccus aquaticus]ATC66025.1 methyltransferase [Nibricoccus aquaticus]
MRISGGAARGITLVTPKGDATRPATDGVRQGVFSSIASRVPGAWFVDLFAGSGAYGLEAVSRGAAGGFFVEKAAKAAACVQKNIAAVCKSAGHDARTLSVAQADVLNWKLPAGAAVPDLIFVDPPYEIIGDVAESVFAKLSEMLAAKDDPVIVFEMPGEITLEPAGWTCVRRLGKGARQPTVCFYRKAERAVAEATT